MFLSAYLPFLAYHQYMNISLSLSTPGTSSFFCSSSHSVQFPDYHSKLRMLSHFSHLHCSRIDVLLSSTRFSFPSTKSEIRSSYLNGRFTHSMPCPCRSPAVPCRAVPCRAVPLRVSNVSFPFDLHSEAVSDSHLPCRAHAML